MAAEVAKKTELECTPVGDIADIVGKCREGARKRLLHPVAERKVALRSLHRMIKENESALLEAVHADIGKHRVEACMTELFVCNEIVYLLDHLDDWVKEKRAPMEGMMAWMGCTIRYDPLGCVLVIGAWNYPIMLAVGPLAGALAAGNTVVLKPSEVSPATAQLLATLVPKYFAPEIVSVVNGGVQETTALLQEHVFDHIMYTGNGTVGRIVMAAAAKHLTPVCLELGGKSPTIVDATCAGKMDVVASRIVWGKYTNSGQTCVAPDYLLIHESVKEEFVRAFAAARLRFMGDNPNVAEDACYSRIVHQRHYERLTKMMDGSCGTIVIGGETSPATLQIGVTLIDDVKLDSPLMQDEIFGPLLPMIPYTNPEEAIAFVNAKAKPLALYVFSEDKDFIHRVKTHTSSGGIVVNDVIMHVAMDNLPFGGVGESGMGNYHGFASFKTFSHAKSIVNDTLRMESLKSVRYAPYEEKKLRLFQRLMTTTGEKSALRKTVGRVISFASSSGTSSFLFGAASGMMIAAVVIVVTARE